MTDPTTGKVVTAPEYGGTLTTAMNSMAPHTDSLYAAGSANFFVSAVIERPAIMDWTIDRGRMALSIRVQTSRILLYRTWQKAGSSPTH